MTEVNEARRDIVQDAVDREINVLQWLLGRLADPANEQELRSVLGNGREKSHVVKHRIVEEAARYGVKESELGSAIKSLSRW